VQNCARFRNIIVHIGFEKGWVLRGQHFCLAGEAFAPQRLHFRAEGVKRRQSFGLRIGCHFENRERGTEAERGRDGGIVKDLVEHCSGARR